MGGTLDNPTYQEVVSGKSGHVEAIEVTYDSSKVIFGDRSYQNQEQVRQGFFRMKAILYQTLLRNIRQNAVIPLYQDNRKVSRVFSRLLYRCHYQQRGSLIDRSSEQKH